VVMVVVKLEVVVALPIASTARGCSI
jgi:hypothetical protein